MRRKIWPECANDFHGFEEAVPDIQHKIIRLDNIGKDDVVKLLETYGEDLSTEDLIQLEQKQAEKEDVSEETEPPKVLTVKRMSEAFNPSKAAVRIFSEDDPKRKCSYAFHKIIKNACLL